MTAETSPFLNGIMSPHGALSIGATLLSPDETPSFALIKSLQAGTMVHTPALPTSSSALFATVQRSSKKRQREDSESFHRAAPPSIKAKTVCHIKEYRIVPSGEKAFSLQPYVIRLLEAMLVQGTADVLGKPLKPDTHGTESEHRRKMRAHLVTRFKPVANSQPALVAFTKKLLKLWGAKLVLKEPTNSFLMKFITPLKRSQCDNLSTSSSNNKSKAKLDDALESEDLLNFDLLDDDEEVFKEAALTEHSTVEDNWACGPKNARRVTYHESPPLTAAVDPKVALSASSKEIDLEPRSKKARTNPKRGMRWTTQERKQFLQGLERWGAGNWKSIHKIIPGRTYVQVKSMGVYLVSKFHMSRGQGPSKAVTDYLMSTSVDRS